MTFWNHRQTARSCLVAVIFQCALSERIAAGLDLESLRASSDAGDISAVEAFTTTDGFGRAAKEIALKRARANRTAQETPERLVLLRDVIEQRSVLLSSYADHPGVDYIAMEQAHDVFFLLWPFYGTRAAAMYGVMDDDQAEIAAMVRKQLPAACLRVHSAAESANDAAGRLREVMPVLEGAAAVINAFELNDPTARKISLGRAAEQLLSRIESLPETAAMEARVYAGLALAELGQFDEAELHFRAVAASATADETLKFMARMGAVRNRVVRGGPAAGTEAIESIEARYAGPDAAFFILMIADAKVALHLQQHPDSFESGSLRPYLELLHTNLGLSDDDRLAVVLDRLCRIIPSVAPPEKVAPEGNIAMALAALRTDGDHDRAIERLRAALARKPIEPAIERAGRVALAELTAQIDPVRSLDVLADALRTAPLAHVDELARRTGAACLARMQTGATDGERPALASALKLCLERAPKHADSMTWRVGSASLLIAGGEFEEARALLAVVPRSSPEWLPSREVLLDLLARWAGSGDGNGSKDRWTAVRHEAAAIRHDVAADESVNGKRVRAMGAIVHAESLRALGLEQEAVSEINSVNASDEALPGALQERVLATRTAILTSAVDDRGAADALRALLAHGPERSAATIALALELIRMREDPKGGGEILEVVGTWLDEAGAFNGAEAIRLALAQTCQNSGAWALGAVHYGRLLRERPDTVELLVGRAECLFQAGRESKDRTTMGEAMAIFRRVSSGLTTQDADFWTSELRMMQILDLTGEGTDQIGRRIARLRLLDPLLGGEATRTALEALEARHIR